MWMYVLWDAHPAGLYVVLHQGLWNIEGVCINNYKTSAEVHLPYILTAAQVSSIQ